MKILFLSNQASKTGAPVVLLEFLKWLKKNSNHQARIILLTDGILFGEFKPFGKILRFEKTRGFFGTAFNYGMKEVFPFIPELINRIKTWFFLLDFKPDLIYANTVVTAPVIPYIRKSKSTPVICHVHELEHIIGVLFGKAGLTKVDPYIDRYIVVAKALEENLRTKHGIPGEKIDLIREHIRFAGHQVPGESISEKIKPDPDTFFVFGCGSLHWFKAPELFILTAREVLRRTKRPFKFIWVGKHEPLALYQQLQYVIDRVNISGHVEFIGFHESPVDLFSGADVFYLTSHEDPYPLVCLEAASQGKPVICFEGSGGMPEFVRDDAGFIVPYLDINAAADRIVRLMDDPGLKSRLGKTGRERVHAENSVEKTGPAILQLIEKLGKEYQR